LVLLLLGTLRSVINKLVAAPALIFYVAISALAPFSTVFPAILKMLEMLRRSITKLPVIMNAVTQSAAPAIF